MFVENKYYRVYGSIISRARASVNRQVERGEKHHILPRSMGGSNDRENLVLLTPREHFICHLLLTKCTTGAAKFKMAAAMNLMIGNVNKRLGRVHVTNSRYDASRFYDLAPFSEEHRRKLSEAAKSRDPATRQQTEGANAKRSAALKGRSKDAAHVEKYAAAQRGKPRESWGSHTEETKKKISAIHKGKPKSAEHRAKISQMQIGRKLKPWSEERRAKFAATIADRQVKVSLAALPGVPHTL